MYKYINALKIASITILFVLLFGFTAFAEPENENNQGETPSVEQTEAVTEREPTQAPDNPQQNTPTQAQNSSSKSGNNDLSNLTVVGITKSGEKINVELSPNFDKATRTYSISVPFEVERIEITASSVDSKAKITIPEGYLKLDIGSNKSFVYVVAENGSRKTYQINTQRNEEVITTEPVTEPVVETEPEAVTVAEVETVPSIELPAQEKSNVNTFTKLGIVFGIGGLILLAIAIAMFIRDRFYRMGV